MTKDNEIQKFQRIMEELGFELKTKVQAEKGPVSIRMENAILPPGIDSFSIFYKIKVYDPGNNYYVEFISDNISYLIKN